MQSPWTAGIEHLYPLKRLEQRILDKIVGVGELAGPGGQPSGRPATERGIVPGEEFFDGCLIAASDAGDELHGRFQRRIPVVDHASLLSAAAQSYGSRGSNPGVRGGCPL